MQNARLLIALALSVAAPLAFAVQDTTCEQSFEAPFAPGGELRLQVRSGDVEIIGSDSEMVRVSCNLMSTEDARRVSIDFESKGKTATLRIYGGPNNNARFRIYVPRRSDLYVRCPAGDLTLSGISGNKDVHLRAGDLTIAVGNPADYARVRASVTAGDLRATAFGVNKGGLFRSFDREQPAGKYRLEARLWAGDLTLR